METTRIVQVDAFTDEPLAGNPAGVVPDADDLSTEQMQAIADEMAVSETAFLRSSAAADRRIRYFTPTQEVDLCGHATIGSFAYLHEREGLEPGTTTLETNVGVLEIEVAEDGTVWMTQDAPQIREVDVGYDRVADALGVDRAALEGASDDIPLAVSSTGLPFLIVPITYLSDLGSADPDMNAVEDLADAVDAAGVYLFTFDALERESTLHGRMFAPGAGVPEDPVTGTASGAVGAYLDRFGAFDDEFPEELRLEQGHYVDRPGIVRVRVGNKDGEGVRVGGRGVVALEGSLVVPDDEEDEILEA
ncbi:PhzF family phenazine biosynthesis protein [Halobiforma lacisalsi AJ5]|uniref:Phenazine biosynthesis protein PhzF family n=1 Tax=Natronobacterium lacisalsi AJ5 TaxID=358396 RepID=M0L2R2_NATLA|nr:PhzF family phenazine biosynthesis protein [Halobiforma lacisalsi]APW96343.1 PhzF family phenazine biosynthesis protein [Halobiforma lacisalsi AJ5]EMA27383.1 phenazine biosynthesis protein PhzF family [Halobiforma lacisalsi AJ5]